ncbi:hypothetical protein M8C21_004368, partial [Ambrosia artemisiifolia]
SKAFIRLCSLALEKPYISHHRRLPYSHRIIATAYFTTANITSPLKIVISSLSISSAYGLMDLLKDLAFWDIMVRGVRRMPLGERAYLFNNLRLIVFLGLVEGIHQGTINEYPHKQMGIHAKDNSDNGGAHKENYIYVRDKRGRATNNNSLGGRVKSRFIQVTREMFGERMKLLQEHVPGCNKINYTQQNSYCVLLESIVYLFWLTVTGKAVLLDEIINYVQSLQQQV